MREFRILGPLEVEDERGPLTLGGQMQRALLALLLLHAGETLAVDWIVDKLWAEKPPPAAKPSLQNFVVQLRKLLGADVLVRKPPGYALRIEHDALDLNRFLRLVAEARPCAGEERAQKLRDALLLWRGPPLDDLRYETCVQEDIRRLEELRLDVIEQRADAELECSAGTALIEELQPLVNSHPSRETLRGQLMLALYRSGRQTEALEVYHDIRRALGKRLAIDPGPALQQLHGAIVRQERWLFPEASRPVEDRYDDIVDAVLTGRLVTVLGPGVNICGEAGLEPLPGPDDVASHLADCFGYPPEEARDLARVSQYVQLMKGGGRLRDELHDFFGRQYAPGPAHRKLVEIASGLHGLGKPPQLIVTANLDHALERAFADAGEPFDVVSYIGHGRHQGKFLHVSAEGAVVVVEMPNTYTELAVDSQTVILRIHGQADPSPQRELESFVVSEDDYMDFLAGPELAGVVPVGLVSKLRRSHFLFLGYPLQVWHVRVFLHRLWGREKVSYRSWAVEPEPDPLELEFWRQRGIDVFDVPVARFLSGLTERLAEGVLV
jgi:DNA-binding SARP family transcriptional activator